MRLSQIKGFTLIELLVVVVLLGIIISIAVFSIGPSGAERLMEQEAQRIHALISLSREEAIIQAKEITLEINKGEYQFLEYKEKKWQPLESKIFKKRQLPDVLELKVETESEIKVMEQDNGELLRLYFLSSGEQSPFKMMFYVKNRQDNYFQIHGHLNGKLELAHVDENEAF